MIRYYYEIEQGSDEWFELRKGKLTGSHATAIGANGAGLITYAKEIISELVGIDKEYYINSDIERGNELEPLAITSYEFTKGVEVVPVGFVENEKYKGVGVSPDGLVGDDGGIEIKARNDIKHLSLILGETKEIPFNQIQMNLLITERKWWDFISYNPNFEKSMFVHRVYPDEKYFEKLKKGFEHGKELIKEYLQRYENYRI